MSTRENDSPAVTPVRAVSVWQVVTFVTPFLVAVGAQGVLLWAGQREQAAEMKHLTAALTELAVTQKAMAIQMNVKDVADVKQDSQLADHERRLNRVELILK